MLNAIKKLFRKSDPETSQEAAEGAQEFVKKHEDLILRAMNSLVSKGPAIKYGMSYGVTKSECATAIYLFSDYKMDSVQVCRRMKELEAAGKVIRTDLKRKNAKGNNETVWRLA